MDSGADGTAGASERVEVVPVTEYYDETTRRWAKRVRWVVNALVFLVVVVVFMVLAGVLMSLTDSVLFGTTVLVPYALVFYSFGQVSVTRHGAGPDVESVRAAAAATDGPVSAQYLLPVADQLETVHRRGRYQQFRTGAGEPVLTVAWHDDGVSRTVYTDEGRATVLVDVRPTETGTEIETRTVGSTSLYETAVGGLTLWSLRRVSAEDEEHGWDLLVSHTTRSLRTPTLDHAVPSRPDDEVFETPETRRSGTGDRHQPGEPDDAWNDP